MQIDTKADQLGFSLIEVMIALTVFAVFVVVFMTSQSQNISDSARLRNETYISLLCENKMSEIIANPPELKESLTLSPEVKTFEKFPEYEYAIEYKRLKLPDMTKLMGQNDEQESEDESAMIKKRVADAVQENMKEMIWQVQVTVKNKSSGEKYFLSGWIKNDKAKVNVIP